jgi:superfamily II DNA/RNA helicase
MKNAKDMIQQRIGKYLQIDFCIDRGWWEMLNEGFEDISKTSYQLRRRKNTWLFSATMQK